MSRITASLPTTLAVTLLLLPLAVTLDDVATSWREWLPIFAAARLGPLALNTLGFVLGTLALALPVGVMAALILFRLEVPGRRAGLILMGGALALPLYLHAAGWTAALGPRGWLRRILSGALAATGTRTALPELNGLSGAVWVQAWAMVPWVALVVGVGLVAVEPELEEDALLDAGWQRVVRRVTLRRAAGSIGGAAVLAAVLSAGDMTVTDLFQVRTYAEEVYTQFALERRSSVGPALMVAGPWMALVWIVLLGLGAWTVRAVPSRLGGRGATPRRFQTGPWRWPLAALLLLGLVCVAGVPFASLVWQAGRIPPPLGSGGSPRWALAAVLETLARALDLGRSGTVRELGYSLLWGGIAAVAATALALSLAWAARGGRRAAWLVAVLAALCLAVPGPVVGVSLATTLNRPAGPGQLVLLGPGTEGLPPPPPRRPGIPSRILQNVRRVPGWIYDSSLVLVWADAIRTLPFAILVIWPMIRTVPATVLEAAAVDGASPRQCYWAVQVPLSATAIGAGFLAAWALALGELAASLIVVPPSTTTLISIRIFQLLHFGLERDLAGACLLLLALTFAISAAAMALLAGGRK